MTIRLIFRTLFFSTVVLVIDSCNSSVPSTPKVEPENNRLTKFQEGWIQMRSNCNKIVFKRYYLHPDSSVIGCDDCLTWADSTEDSKLITEFSGLFTDIQDGGYCCCPFRHFSITFFRDTTELGNYFADTLTTKGEAMFFDGIYQTSYYIKTKDWNTFLRTLTKTNNATATTR